MQQLKFDYIGPGYFQDAPTSYDAKPDTNTKSRMLALVWQAFWDEGFFGLTDNELKQKLGATNPGLGARRFELRHRWCQCGHVHYLKQDDEDYWLTTRALCTSNRCTEKCPPHAFRGLVRIDYDPSASSRPPSKEHLRQVYPTDSRARKRASGDYNKAGIVHVSYQFYSQWAEQRGPVAIR